MGLQPTLTIIYGNGNLLQNVDAVDGKAAIVGTGKTAGLLGTPMTVYNLKDAETQGITAAAEPDMHRHIEEFYGEVGGSVELRIMLVPDTMTMTQMLDNTNESGAKKLLKSANGVVRLLGVFRKPATGYTGGADFIDSDVAAAILKAKTFGDARLAELAPIRTLIEGRVQNASAPNTLTPTQSANGYAGVVLGGTQNDGSASIGLVLGRAVKYAAHIKIGKVANGPLSIDAIYIGTKALGDVLNLKTLHDAGFISFMTYTNQAGFFLGRDSMASDDDYRLLAYGRVVDKTALIAAAVYIKQIESEVDINADGTIEESDVKHLQDNIRRQVTSLMGDQISGFSVNIDPAQDVINTNKLVINLSVRPKGYTTNIEINIGLSAPIAS